MDTLFKANFYPGPSKLYAQVPEFANEAFAKGILSMNHRSPVFEELYRLTKQHLFSFLNVPANYHLVFTSSATECWEIISQSLVAEKSYHLYNGNFGRKWFEYAKAIKPESEGHSFSVNTLIRPEDLRIPLENEWICITQNETSNGTQVHDEIIAAIKKAHPDQFIAVDATSSLAGLNLHIENADLWFGSVQKCFGLPSGLGIMIFSDEVIAKAEEINDTSRYNSFLHLVKNAQKYQTHYTPNMLGIYLLYRLAYVLPNVQEIGEKVASRAKNLYNYFQGYAEFQTISQNPACLSDTVLAFEGEPGFIMDLKTTASHHGFILGNGYGDWKNTSFRIANFPAITDSEVEGLLGFFNQF